MATKKQKKPLKKVKKAAAKKPAKKVAAKKPTKKVAAKKPTKKVAAKKPAKKVAAKKPAKMVVVKKPVKKAKRVPQPIRIIKRVVPTKPLNEDYVPIDTAKAVAFGMSIVAQMKKAAAKANKGSDEESVRLSRRPVTRTQGKNTVKFPASDLKDFKKRLLEARAKASQGVNAMKATGFNESEDHEADGGDGTAQTLRLQALGQMGNINRTIQQIDEALHRIDDGSYGVCTLCGQLIRKPRLLNQPFVLTCMECQSEIERGNT